MADILVIVPKKEYNHVYHEKLLGKCLGNPGMYVKYSWWDTGVNLKDVEARSRIYFVWNNKLIGFAMITRVVREEQTTRMVFYPEQSWVFPFPVEMEEWLRPKRGVRYVKEDERDIMEDYIAESVQNTNAVLLRFENETVHLNPTINLPDYEKLGLNLSDYYAAMEAKLHGLSWADDGQYTHVDECMYSMEPIYPGDAYFVVSDEYDTYPVLTRHYEGARKAGFFE